MNNAADAVTVRHSVEEAASALPPLLAMAERVAMVVAQGEHGRRRAGTGDSFGQYRRYQAGDPVQNIDWRQSAKSARLRSGKRMGISQNIYLWGSVGQHELALPPGLPVKADRAVVITLAMASLLIRGGERISRLEQVNAREVGRS